MNYIKSRRLGNPSEEESPCLYVPTTTCRLCGKEVSLSPTEMLDNLRKIGEGTYVCPLCRLMEEAARNDIEPDDMNPADNMNSEDDVNSEDDRSSWVSESLVSGFITPISDLMIIGSWMMRAAKYNLPENLAVEMHICIANLMIYHIMEDERNDDDETESDSDEAAEACAGGGGAKPPEGPVPGTAESGGSGISFQADLQVQAFSHLIFQIQDTTT